MNTEPLNEEELDFLNEQLLEYGNDDAILDLAELDGFLTAIVSGPEVVPPSLWLSELWGGPSNEPDWPDEVTAKRFFSLVFQHMNDIATVSMSPGGHFEPLVHESEMEREVLVIAEEWCLGYMRGVALGNWPALPAEVQASLDNIALHGTDAGFAKIAEMPIEEHQLSAQAIGPAVIALHAYWLEQRSPPGAGAAPTQTRTGPKVGRNESCPCGSGKKYKHCCLH